jgi:Putative adhesin
MVSPGTDARVRLRVSAISGRVTVVAEARGDVVVERGGSTHATVDGSVEVRAGRPSDAVVVRCPASTDVIVGTRSGNVELDGRFGTVGVTSLSGSIRAETADEADLRTISGVVELEDCGGRCRVSTKSGRIRVGRSGEVDVSTVSGSVGIDEVAGPVNVRSVSGKVTIGASSRGAVHVRTVSGSITIRLPAGVRPLVRYSGRGSVRSAFEPGDDVLIDVANMSGAVRLVSA